MLDLENDVDKQLEQTRVQTFDAALTDQETIVGDGCQGGEHRLDLYPKSKRSQISQKTEVVLWGHLTLTPRKTINLLLVQTVPEKKEAVETRKRELAETGTLRSRTAISS